MEVNARLQVEHPVTEFVTGVDIVHQQIKIAAGEGLRMCQTDINLNGHAIEARIYAEDPVSFLPSPGIIEQLILPMTNENLRIDHAMKTGGTVPPYYDPMLAKVIAWGATRKEAIACLNQGLNDFRIEGVKTTIPVDLQILKDKLFCAGEFYTGFIDDLLKKIEEVANERI
jgi:acetyl-CoA carboxylase biotin carboxylase subunit